MTSRRYAADRRTGILMIRHSRYCKALAGVPPEPLHPCERRHSRELTRIDSKKSWDTCMSRFVFASTSAKYRAVRETGPPLRGRVARLFNLK
jgi:hypothetical protein